jgi:hypothetical protein
VSDHGRHGGQNVEEDDGEEKGKMVVAYLEVSSLSQLKKEKSVSARPNRSVRKNIRDQVVAVLGLLQTTESHLGTRNVLLGVLEVLELQTLHISLWIF